MSQIDWLLMCFCLLFTALLAGKIENRVVVSTPTHTRDEMFAHVEVIKRNVKNLLKIAKRDSWTCNRSPQSNGKELLGYSLSSL